MKKLIATVICLTILVMTSLPATAQTRSRYRNDRRSERQSQRVYRNTAYQNYDYRTDEYVYGRDRTVWEKHRDKITTAGGAAGGAILGGLIGGKKGAIIGAITGGAGAAVYTYKIRDKFRRY
jgi:uncharacterized membrane protein